MSARFTVLKVAGEKDLTDDEVFTILKAQMHRQLNGGTLIISYRATPAQVDKSIVTMITGV